MSRAFFLYFCIVMSKMITVLGPTATGKTKLAVQLAAHFNGAIISGDSRQVYQGMDIGTGKDLQEYTVNGQDIPYFLIDNKKAGYEYNVFEYQVDFYKALDQVQAENKLPILCGGTGMYIEAILKGYQLLRVPNNVALRSELDSKSQLELVERLKTLKPQHNSTDTTTLSRTIRAIEIAEYCAANPDKVVQYPPIDTIIIGNTLERSLVKEKITKRLKQRFKEGMVEEVENLHRDGLSYDQLKFYGLEYKYISQFLNGEISRQDMFLQLNIAIHQFSKRQMTWFRRMEKNGFTIHWLDAAQPFEDNVATACQLIEGHLKS